MDSDAGADCALYGHTVYESCIKGAKAVRGTHMGAISGLIYFAHGMLTMVILITYLAACVLAELVRYAVKYRSLTENTISFAAFSLA
jgi:energy-coupling factor transport system substrate-specific component